MRTLSAPHPSSVTLRSADQHWIRSIQAKKVRGAGAKRTNRKAVCLSHAQARLGHHVLAHPWGELDWLHLRCVRDASRIKLVFGVLVS